MVMAGTMLAGRARRFVAVVIAGVVLATAPAQAQISGEPPLTQQGADLSLDALGHHLAMPLPDWLGDSGDAIGAVETHYVSDDSQALLEIYPRGETQALWNTLYGARIALGPDRPLKALRSAIMISYSRTCQPALTGFFQFNADEGDELAPLGFVCGAYRDRLHADLGVVMVIAFRKTTRGIAVVYQQWRGAAFNPATPAAWPVDTGVVQARAAQLQGQTMLTTAN